MFGICGRQEAIISSTSEMDFNNQSLSRYSESLGGLGLT